MSIRETHENITLFHYSGCFHIYLKPMENIILKKNIGGHYLKSPKKKYNLQSNLWQKIVRNYTSCYLKPMEINTQNLS